MTTNTALTALPRTGAALEHLAARTTAEEFSRLCVNVLGTFAVHLRNAAGDRSAAAASFLAANGQGAACVLLDLLADPTMAEVLR